MALGVTRYNLFSHNFQTASNWSISRAAGRRLFV